MVVPHYWAYSHALLTRPPLYIYVHPKDCISLPLDLHVLGLPPAFNLSHDQTLQFKSFLLVSTLSIKESGETSGSITQITHN